MLVTDVNALLSPSEAVLLAEPLLLGLESPLLLEGVCLGHRREKLLKLELGFDLETWEAAAALRSEFLRHILIFGFPFITLHLLLDKRLLDIDIFELRQRLPHVREVTGLIQTAA